eukprot:4114557-Pyramimonas_sp.AAC.1
MISSTALLNLRNTGKRGRSRESLLTYNCGETASRDLLQMKYSMVLFLSPLMRVGASGILRTYRGILANNITWHVEVPADDEGRSNPGSLVPDPARNTCD